MSVISQLCVGRRARAIVCAVVMAESALFISGCSSSSAQGAGGVAAGGAAGVPSVASGGSSSGGTTTSSTGGSSTASGGASGASTGTGGSSRGGGPAALCPTPANVVAPGPDWVTITGNLASLSTGCGNMGAVQDKPCSSAVIGGVANQGLWQSDDGRATWHALGTGQGSAQITNVVLNIIPDPEHPDTFWETGLFGNGGLYATEDGGKTFAQLGTLSMTELVSVDFNDPERKTLVAGTHGQKQQVYRSTDKGKTWVNIGLNLPSTTHNSESPVVIDAQTYLLGACGYGDGVCGIFRTTDAGASWTSVSDLQVSHFGAPLWASDGTIYWPMFANSGMAKSTDLGKSWKQVVQGTVRDTTPRELPDGSIVTLGTDHVMRSTNGGVSWQAIGKPYPFTDTGGLHYNLAYSAQTKTLYLAYGDCGNAVLPNAVSSAGFDYTTK